MDKINQVLDEIKKIECPTGELEKRIEGILEDYGLAYKNTIVARDEKLNKDGQEAFCANTNNGRLVVMASSGMDDYVAKVENVYMK